MRTFVAIELDAAAHRQLARVLPALPRHPDVRWVGENQLHITLKFLGEVTDAQLAGVCDVVSRISAALPRFPLAISGIGAFPNARRPRVLWCGITDPKQSCRLWVERADPEFAALGFPPEERAFTPHITLGRSKAPAGARAMERVLTTLQLPLFPVMTCERVTVFESTLSSHGATYRAVLTAPLGT